MMALVSNSLCAQTNSDINGLKLVNIRVTTSVIKFSGDSKSLPTFHHVPVKVGDKKGDFEVTAVSPTNITFVRNGKAFVLQKGIATPFRSIEIEFSDLASHRSFIQRVGDEFVYGTNSFCITDVNQSDSTCSLKDLKSSAVFILKKSPR
jgi:hypothetical protein